jgi:hypothetical protein
VNEEGVGSRSEEREEKEKEKGERRREAGKEGMHDLIIDGIDGRAKDPCVVEM